MQRYEEERYLFENIKDKIYPWIREDYYATHTLNGKHLSPKKTTAIAYLGELKVFFAIKRGEESYEIVEDTMLPPDINPIDLFHIACENMAKDVEFVVGSTMYGAYAIIADGIHEASSILLKQIWDMCAEKLKGDLIIAMPTTETVLFMERKYYEKEKLLKTFLTHVENTKAQSNVEKLSDQFLIYEYETRELKLFER